MACFAGAWHAVLGLGLGLSFWVDGVKGGTCVCAPAPPACRLTLPPPPPNACINSPLTIHPTCTAAPEHTRISLPAPPAFPKPPLLTPLIFPPCSPPCSPPPPFPAALSKTPLPPTCPPFQAHNQLTGTIPTYRQWSIMTALTNLDVSNTYVTGTTPQYFPYQVPSVGEHGCRCFHHGVNGVNKATDTRVVVRMHAHRGRAHICKLQLYLVHVYATIVSCTCVSYIAMHGSLSSFN